VWSGRPTISLKAKEDGPKPQTPTKQDPNRTNKYPFARQRPSSHILGSMGCGRSINLFSQKQKDSQKETKPDAGVEPATLRCRWINRLVRGWTHKSLTLYRLS
jgi:hypothetical protein